MKYLNGLITNLFVILQLSGLAFQIDYPWMYYIPYGQTVILKPLYRNKSAEDVIVTRCKWTTPLGLELLPDNYNYDQYRYKIDKTKCELTIYDIQKDTNGIYHATVNDFYISKAMLNVHGAPKKSAYEEWKPNLIAGFSAFGGVIAFFLFTCGIYKFRYQEPPKYNNSNHSLENSSSFRSGNFYKNQSFDQDEKEVDQEFDKTSEELQNVRL